MDNKSDSDQMGKVLNFPLRKDRSVYRYSLVLTVASVFLFATFMNQVQLAISPLTPSNYMAGEKIKSEDRFVASINPNEFQEIMMEQKLAESIKGDFKSSLSISSFDQFVYGALKGKFRVKLQRNSDHIIESLSLIDLGDVKAMGLDLQNRLIFLNRYKNFFGDSIESIKKIESVKGAEIFNLLGKNNISIGKLKLAIDDEGRVIDFSRVIQ